MTSKLTRERLQEIAEDGFLKHGESKVLARMALAAMDSEPVAWTWHYREQWHVTNDKCRAEFVATDGDVAVVPLYRHAQPAPVVPEEITSATEGLKQSLVDCNRYNYCFDAVTRVENACRAAMLQAEPVCTCPSGDGSLRWPCPVHPGNSPAIPDAARDALEKALTAMEFMGDTLNNLDAVCSEDVEFVTPAFDAVRRVLAAAPQEVKGE
ncbi:hypothetical protein [Klebsiella variicola]|uniref:hypothetical protein n=1 Tax=Klebsiella variicola TaxID=244366 RepID=UPI001E4CD5A5|nr:hypothetical protein [Klebsiella variicola]